MEHRRTQDLIRQLTTVAIGSMLCLSLSACRQPNKTPEALDPIFSDLNNELKAMESAADSEEKAIETLATEFGDLGPRDKMRSRTKRDLEVKKAHMVRLKQLITYQKILIERRRSFARNSYANAYRAKKEDEWPNPEEFAEYTVNKRLKRASRNWADRVPRLHKDSPSGAAPQKPESGGHGEAKPEAHGETPPAHGEEPSGH